MHSCIYAGVVRHRRGGDVAHEFRYPLAWHFIDLSEVSTLQRRGLLGRSRWSIASMCVRDHQQHDADVSGDGHGAARSPLNDVASLDTRLRDRVERTVGARPRGAVRMLTQLTHLGIYFSPLTLYYLYESPDEPLGDERLAAVVAEVNNTPWGEQHNYVLARKKPPSVLSSDSWCGFHSRQNPTTAGASAVAEPCHTASPWQPLRAFEHRKDFHVSPFMTAGRRYQWRLTHPGSRLSVRIASVPEGAGTVRFDATMSLRRRRWTRGQHLRLLAGRPLTPLWILGAIYWEAARLWWKGAGFVPHPRRSDG